jgi:hypothetical protein
VLRANWTHEVGLCPDGGSGLGVEGLGFRIQKSEIRIQGSGLRVEG